MRLTVTMLMLGSSVLSAQTGLPGSIQGTVSEQHGLPIAGATVYITRTFAPKELVTPYSQSLKTASDGSFQAQGLPPGTYAFCAQVPGDIYLDGCHWGAPLLDVTVSAGQKLRTAIRVTKASTLKVRVLDPGGSLAAIAAKQAGPPANGKAPLSPVTAAPVLMGVWDGHGHFFPLHLTGGHAGHVDYQLAIPFDTPLSFQITTSTLQLADSLGAPLPTLSPGLSSVAGQSSLTSFQHNSGDPNPKSFQFTVTGVRP